MQMRRHLKVLVSAGLVAGLAAGCQSMKSKTATFDSTRLAGMNESQLTEVRAAEAQVEEAQSELEAAKRAETEAQRRVEMAKSEHDVLKAELEQAKSRAKIAKERGEVASVEDVPEVKSAEQLVKASEKKISYLESLLEARQAQTKLAEKTVALAKTKVDQAGFLALQEHNPEEARAIEPREADFRAKVASAQAEVSQAQADVARMKSAAMDSYDQWLAMERQIGQEGRQALAPPPAPQTLEQDSGQMQEMQEEPEGIQSPQQQEPMEEEMPEPMTP